MHTLLHGCANFHPFEKQSRTSNKLSHLAQPHLSLHSFTSHHSTTAPFYHFRSSSFRTTSPATTSHFLIPSTIVQQTHSFTPFAQFKHHYNNPSSQPTSIAAFLRLSSNHHLVSFLHSLLHYRHRASSNQTFTSVFFSSEFTTRIHSLTHSTSACVHPVLLLSHHRLLLTPSPHLQNHNVNSTFHHPSSRYPTSPPFANTTTVPPSSPIFSAILLHSIPISSLFRPHWFSASPMLFCCVPTPPHSLLLFRQTNTTHLFLLPPSQLNTPPPIFSVPFPSPSSSSPSSNA